MNGVINNQSKVYNSAVPYFKSYYYDVSKFRNTKIKIYTSLSFPNISTTFSFLQDIDIDDWVEGFTPDFCANTSANVIYESLSTRTVPADANYLVVTAQITSTPQGTVTITALETLKEKLVQTIEDVKDVDSKLTVLSENVTGIIEVETSKNGVVLSNEQKVKYVSTGNKTDFYNVERLRGKKITINNSVPISAARVYFFLKSLSPWTENTAPDFCSNCASTIMYADTVKLTVPDDAVYIAMTSQRSNVNYVNTVKPLDNIVDAIAAVDAEIEEIVINSNNKESNWVRESIESGSGAHISSTVRIRYNQRLSDSCLSIKANNGYRIYLYAYTNKGLIGWDGGYKGCWDGTTFTVSPTSFTELNIERLRKEYDYYYCITVQSPTASTIDTTAYDNIVIKDLYISETLRDLSYILSPTSIFNNIVFPKYVFGISFKEIGTKATVVYKEGVMNYDNGLTIDGNVFIKEISAAKQESTQTITLKKNNQTYNYQVSFKNINPKFVDASGIRVLCIGDSMTEGGQNNPLVIPINGRSNKFQNWVSYIGYMNSANNVINGQSLFNIIGANTKHECAYEYNSETVNFDTYNEGHSGWSSTNFLNHPMWFIMHSLTSATRFAREEVWYILGLATKTYYDAEGYNTNYEIYTDSVQQRILLLTTVFGRYKIDHTESIWNKIQVQDRTFQPGVSWSGTASQKQAIDDWFASMISDQMINRATNYQTSNAPNRFFDLNKARAYTGSHEWTYDNAFSIDKYLERYRNLDNSGNPLVGSDGETVVGQDGNTYTIGTCVSKCQTCHVCVPTHVIVALGANDILDSTTEINNMKLLLEAILGYGVQTAFLEQRFHNGVFDVAEWKNCYAAKMTTPRRDNYIILNANMQNTYYENLGDSSSIQFIPAYFVQNPVSSAMDKAALNLFGEKVLLQDNSDDHIGYFAHEDVGRQAYGWLLYSIIE